jgi:hypothetical protein
MQSLSSSPQEPPSQLIHFFVELLGRLDCCQQVSWQRTKNSFDQLLPATDIQEVSLPTLHLVCCPIEDILQVVNPQPINSNRKSQIRDQESCSGSSKVVQNIVQIDLGTPDWDYSTLVHIYSQPCSLSELVHNFHQNIQLLSDRVNKNGGGGGIQREPEPRYPVTKGR